MNKSICGQVTEVEEEKCPFECDARQWPIFGTRVPCDRFMILCRGSIPSVRPRGFGLNIIHCWMAVRWRKGDFNVVFDSPALFSRSAVASLLSLCLCSRRDCGRVGGLMTMTTSNRQRTRTEVKSELVFIDRSVKVGQFSRWMTHQRPKIGGYHRVGVVWLVVLFCSAFVSRLWIGQLFVVLGVILLHLISNQWHFIIVVLWWGCYLVLQK